MTILQLFQVNIGKYIVVFPTDVQRVQPTGFFRGYSNKGLFLIFKLFNLFLNLKLKIQILTSFNFEKLRENIKLQMIHFLYLRLGL